MHFYNFEKKKKNLIFLYSFYKQGRPQKEVLGDLVRFSLYLGIDLSPKYGEVHTQGQIKDLYIYIYN